MNRLLMGVTALLGCTIVLVSWGLSSVFRYEYKDLQYGPISTKTLIQLQEGLLRFRSGTVPGEASALFSLRPCNVNFDPIPERLNVGHAININARVSLPNDAEQCQSELEFYAAAFTVEPKDRVTVKLTKGKPSQDVLFNILPTEEGKQAIVYGADRSPNGATPTVYQYAYISPALSVWFPALGTLFGGMLTVPWWLRFFGIPRVKDDNEDQQKARKRKSKEDKRRKTSAA
jgi:hypothetical protein